MLCIFHHYSGTYFLIVIANLGSLEFYMKKYEEWKVCNRLRSRLLSSVCMLENQTMTLTINPEATDHKIYFNFSLLLTHCALLIEELHIWFLQQSEIELNRFGLPSESLQLLKWNGNQRHNLKNLTFLICNLNRLL